MAFIHEIIKKFPKTLKTGDSFEYSEAIAPGQTDVPYGTPVKVECEIKIGDQISVCSDEDGYFAMQTKDVIPNELVLD